MGTALEKALESLSVAPHLDFSMRTEAQRPETKDPAFCSHALGEHVSVI